MSDFAKKEREAARELRRSDWWKNIRGKGICHYCQKKFPARDITMDHVIPVASGGRSVKSNVVPSCHGCNREKRDIDPLEQLFSQIKKESD